MRKEPEGLVIRSTVPRSPLLAIYLSLLVSVSRGDFIVLSLFNLFQFLLYSITCSSSNANSLRIAMCYPITSEGLTEALVKLLMLEVLGVSYCSLSAESLGVVGRSCPNLKTLKLNRERSNRFSFFSDDFDALVIAETMPRLRHLQLFGNKLTDAGLNAILDNLSGDLKKRCCERVNVLRKPFDSTLDYPYDDAVIHKESCHFFSFDSDYSDFD